MKHIKKLLAFAIVAVMMLSLCGLGAYAQEVPVGSGSGSITITNAAISETYAIYKLFDATVALNEDGESVSIAYTGEIPTALANYFTKDAVGNITATDAAKANDGTLSEGAVAAIAAWASGQTALEEEECTSTPMSFTGLDYGYYVVTSTQGSSAISVDSTNPDAQIIDKNTTPPINNLTKTIDDDDVFVGQTVTYTVTFDTSNYYVPTDESGQPAGEPEQILSYTIADDFAGGVLTDVEITSLTISKEGFETVTIDVDAFDENGEVLIPWVDDEGASLYPNGATITLTYTGLVSGQALIDADEEDGSGNVNTVTVTFVTEKGEGYKEEESEEFFSYALAIKKVDQSGNPLEGATFELPFYVTAAPDTDGAYVYAGEEEAAETGYTTNTLTTPEDGLIIIKGIASGTYTFSETEAPAGYNKLADDVSIEAVQTGKRTTKTTTWLDKDGNIVDQESEAVSTVIVEIADLGATPVVVVNKSGTEMPATGGIGTTIFYVVGSILVIGAAIVLVTKKRVSQKF